jgi:hypothetical protein
MAENQATTSEKSDSSGKLFYSHDVDYMRGRLHKLLSPDWGETDKQYSVEPDTERILRKKEVSDEEDFLIDPEFEEWGFDLPHGAGPDKKWALWRFES